MKKIKQKVKPNKEQIINILKSRCSSYKIIIVLLFFGILLFASMAMYYHAKLNTQEQVTTILCEMNNKELDIIKDTYPVWANQSCITIKGLGLNTNSTNYLCSTLINVKFPDRLDCEDYIL